MEERLLDELRTIKMLRIANFIELQEIRRELDIADETSGNAWYAYANATSGHLEALDVKLRRLFKDDLPRLWEMRVGPHPEQAD